MTVKEWLKNGRRLQFEIQALTEARNKALNRAIGGAVNYGTERVQASSGNGTEHKFISYSQYAAELERRMEELTNYRLEMLRLIARLPDSTHRALLTEYYINCKSWEDVADSIGYEERQTRRLHGEALQKMRIYFEDVRKCP